MIEDSFGELGLLRFERLSEEPNLAHAFTTRPHNFAPHYGPDRNRAIYWRQRVCEILEVTFDNLTAPQQVHGGDIIRIVDQDVGRGKDGRNSAVRFVDGLITDRPNVPIIMLSADCPLICAYDPDAPAIGVAHASWRGTVGRIAKNLIRQMVTEFDSDPSRIIAAISPSAGPCCYEVDSQVYRMARTRLDRADACFTGKGDKYMFDLWQANQQQLIGRGVMPENIEIAQLCSICDKRFWSHRRDGKNAGRSALFVSLC
ncbi:MAG: peptidoglycan editing factor PgeF [Planctomycetota bacterium]|jgi:YfiH family protein